MQPWRAEIGRSKLHVTWPERPFIAVAVTVVSIIILVAAATMPAWLPRLVRTLIPDRYLETYAPEFVTKIVFQRVGSGETLSSEGLSDGGQGIQQAQSLLDQNFVVTEASSGNNSLPSSTVAEDTTLVSPSVNAAQLPPIPASYELEGFTHSYQGWNNCGPATLSTTLSYWGSSATQNDVANFVKPNPEDRNVRPDELVKYAEENGYNAVVRVNGNLETLKRLIAAGYPPIIEQGFEVEKLGWMGHYVVLTGYTDEGQVFTSQDSYLGPNHIYSYAAIETEWWHFNRTYLVVYLPGQANEVGEIVGKDLDDRTMWLRSADRARVGLQLYPDDPYGWFNLGSSLVALENYDDAAVAFDRARELGLPWRMLWYQFGPYEAYLHVGRYDDVRLLADITLADNIYSEEAYFYKAQAYQAENRLLEARSWYETAIQYNSHYDAARSALDAIKP